MKQEQTYMICGSHDRAVTLLATGAEHVELCNRVFDVADPDGMIQDKDMVILFPNRPELHKTSFLYPTLLAAGAMQHSSDYDEPC